MLGNIHHKVLIYDPHRPPTTATDGVGFEETEMGNRHPSVLIIAFVAAASVANLPPVSASSDPQVDSREYKLMLEASRFRGSNPVSVIDEMWNGPMRQLIQGLDGIEVKGGGFELEKDRAVRFWDTGGGGCTLRKHGYAFRERVKVKDGMEVDKKREVTLKFRHQQAEGVTAKDLRGTHADAKQKFKMDIGIVGDPGLPLGLVYSKSTTQPIGKNKKINSMADPLELFPGLEAGLTEEGATVDRSQELEMVSNLDIRERVYGKPTLDFGAAEAEVSVTLWYDKQAGELREPLVAEFSFKIDGPTFDTNTLDQAKSLSLALQRLPWADLAASTKTSFVYQYRNFCP